MREAPESSGSVLQVRTQREGEPGSSSQQTRSLPEAPGPPPPDWEKKSVRFLSQPPEGTETVGALRNPQDTFQGALHVPSTALLPWGSVRIEKDQPNTCTAYQRQGQQLREENLKFYLKKKDKPDSGAAKSALCPSSPGGR